MDLACGVTLLTLITGYQIILQLEQNSESFIVETRIFQKENTFDDDSFMATTLAIFSF